MNRKKLGCVSLASWIVVYSPQIYENYSLQSGEGLSVLFVLVWLLGDFCNLLGAVLAKLLPTVIALAIYYSLCDLTLLIQIYYYRWKRHSIMISYPPALEEEPLLTPEGGEVDEPPSQADFVVRYVGALCFVFMVGIVAWLLSGNEGSAGQPEAPPRGPEWLIQGLGWTSAVSYLGARIPQIIKNFKTRCDGLSPALFFFAIFGNVTYGLSICAKSMERDYLIMNASWLAGSILTVFLDIIVSEEHMDLR
ncbi:hypothetical protein AMATHDRAFT_73104 [Amanita thiersii Skay4041]|uniref:Uncharacterized protein n=1 Tax=Amanita thiersii Skay4041 TaxID=703135 RepID=A0A2A9NX97_9AGAR|nr:hypothetical protein AMATHDRAFT_73104 [Amanita thiersii Skay4041]